MRRSAVTHVVLLTIVSANVAGISAKGAPLEYLISDPVLGDWSFVARHVAV